MTDPSLTPGDQATIVGIGSAVLLAVSGGIWRASSLRGDINARWRKRVDFAVARIDELIVNELRILRDEIDVLLPGPGNFDPALVVADPVSLSERAGHVAKLDKIRKRMESDLSRSRAVGPVLIFALIALALGTIGATAYYGELVDGGLVRIFGLALIGLGVVSLTLATAIYAFFQNRLSAGEIEAGADLRDGLASDG